LLREAERQELQHPNVAITIELLVLVFHIDDLGAQTVEDFGEFMLWTAR
jgi:hypothetical protein